MRAVTKASLAYIATQVCLTAEIHRVLPTKLMQARFALTSAQVFSRTDHVTDSERFYNSILELLDDREEKEEVDQLLMWWNRRDSYNPLKYVLMISADKYFRSTLM